MESDPESRRLVRAEKLLAAPRTKKRLLRIAGPIGCAQRVRSMQPDAFTTILGNHFILGALAPNGQPRILSWQGQAELHEGVSTATRRTKKTVGVHRQQRH